MAAATGTMQRNHSDWGHDSAARDEAMDDTDADAAAGSDDDDEMDTTASRSHSLSSTAAAAAHGTSCDHMPIESSSRMDGTCRAPVSQNARSVDGANETSNDDATAAAPILWKLVSMEMLSG